MGRKLIKPGFLDTGETPVPQEGGEGCARPWLDRISLYWLRINTQSFLTDNLEDLAKASIRRVY